jgi:hypothetical protein
MIRDLKLNAVHFVESLGNSPAMVNRKTGEAYFSLEFWNILPKEHRLFVLLHELAHYSLNTSDEIKADALAFKLYSDMGYSLTQSVRALTKILSFKNPEHWQRVYMQLERAAKFDVMRNGNNKAIKVLNKLNFKK